MLIGNRRQRPAGTARSRHALAILLVTALAAAAVALTGCGGGDGDAGAQDAPETLPAETQAAGDSEADAPAEEPTVDPGAVPPPGEARVEVDGEVYVFRAGESSHYDCAVGEDEVLVNYQETDSGDFLFSATRQSGDWYGNLTFLPTGDDVYNGLLSPSEPGLALGTGAFTYTGTVTYGTRTDPTTTRDVEASIAASCSTSESATETAETPETETSAPATGGGAAPAPGQGTLSLDDGRSYSIAIGECEFRENGTIEVKGTSDEGSTFDMTQFQLGDEWRQTDASIQFANGDQIYVIVSSASPDGAPAEVEGKTITWEQTFQELDESANSIVYRGSGKLRLACP
ncbi:MAG: hypothetical protein M5U27_10945 [Gaiella sp.]|nr:hypothetical protein [Gaiella sp.]